MQSPAIDERATPVHACRRADHRADQVAGQVDVRGHAAGQIVLQDLDGKAEAAAGQRGEEGYRRDAQPGLQRRHGRKPERHIGEDVGGQIEARVVAWPGGCQKAKGGAPVSRHPVRGCRLA
ncbi:MAG: hypothetical protein M5R42_04685 [Rhodocyclaceae bacterium]|nr:hypothetical protein [Rhodocyclaceae bacterium]